MDEIGLERLSYAGVAEYLKRSQTIILPLGAIEQHGANLPLGTDTMIARAMAGEVGRRAGRLVAPCLSPGVSLVPHMDYPGTMTFMPATFMAMIGEAFDSLWAHGFRTFLVVNGHGGNDGPLLSAVAAFRYRRSGVKIDLADWWEMEPVAAHARKALGREVGHGCACEASLVMHLDPGLVSTESPECDMIAKPYKVSGDLAARHLTTTGLMGADQQGTSPELGAALFDLAVTGYLGMIEAMEAD